MNKFRQFLNTVTILLLALTVFAWGFLLSVLPWSALFNAKFTLFSVFVGMLFGVQLWITIVSWRHMGTLKLQTAIWGLGLASASFFSMVVISIGVLLVGVIQSTGVWGDPWQLAVSALLIFASVLFLLASGFLNLKYFKNRLLKNNS
jgi:hypothetical protein